MIVIEYTPEGEPMSDFDVEKWVEVLTNAAPESDVRMAVCNGLFIRAVLCAVAEGRISDTNVYFVFNGYSVLCNKYGAIPHWPAGFADAEGLLCERTLKAAMTKRKRNKEIYQ